MTELLDMFYDFLNDDNAANMYITGVAGTGKTTSLAELIRYCIKLNLRSVTCAYTHKAVGVLRSKLPADCDLHNTCTLHSFLKKRPTINMDARKVKDVEGNSKAGLEEIPKVLFVDEFSMIGEKDYVDLADFQYDPDGNILMKIVYIGDPNQLPPVKDLQVVKPSGKYWMKLTKIYRQAGDNPLIDTLININDYINGAEAKPLLSHSNFKRGENIVKLYKNCNTSKIILAFTNEVVEELNAEIEGKTTPDIADKIYSPTIRKEFTLTDMLDTTNYVIKINGDLLDIYDDKYKSIETLHQLDKVKFYQLTNENSDDLETFNYACVFGHKQYLDYNKQLAGEAVKYNKLIEKEFGVNPVEWAKDNRRHELAIDRAIAWKRYLAFKECVICVDFPHAMTIHKSQGSTYDNVFLDIDDIGKCANSNYNLYLRLLYVAISRASDTVYTN